VLKSLLGPCKSEISVAEESWCHLAAVKQEQVAEDFCWNLATVEEELLAEESCWDLANSCFDLLLLYVNTI
jgi:hypothetical protein